ncbi:MAG: UDP-N-acetylmuramate--L-alanine ligase, partial [Caulobacteraceae bacterium]|nr:UDP-N-acetylmuramate--L-alanine ligase [Caulobacteraceae bacterium]
MHRNPTPFDLGPVHFIGIGGIGMSGIAEIMLRRGYTVQGSDARASANTDRLAALGARIFIGHDDAHVEGASAIVFSSAIRADNPEMAAGRARKIPLVRRAEMLAELMRTRFGIAIGGAHGKTTTTSLVAALLGAGGLDPTVVNGGIINDYGANAKIGEGEWMVVEADESDGTFLNLRATACVVTNIDLEHLDHYGSFEALKAAFDAFVRSIPFYGFAVLCADDANVQALAAQIENRRLITYGFNPQADVRAVNLRDGPEGTAFDVQFEGGGAGGGPIAGFTMSIPGRHNVLNALGAIAVAHELNVGPEAMKRGLAHFGGVRRRFTTTGVVRGVRIVDDYGHHPTEIENVLAAARTLTQRRVVAIVQPHRYSRLRDLFAEFCR